MRALREEQRHADGGPPRSDHWLTAAPPRKLRPRLIVAAVLTVPCS